MMEMEKAIADRKSAVWLAGEIASGRVRQDKVWDDFESALEKHEPTVKSLSFTEDVEARRARFTAADASGPLAGLPVGIKDVFDTYDLPTAYGSPIYEDHQPVSDAVSVACIRAAGGVIAGKTVTTEFAYFTPGPTTNPHNQGHTPGGSSSGSAAAVAAGIVPFATGTQTGGSVIRPAAFCGVVGYKPTFDLIPTIGLKAFAWSLDTVGIFAQSVADAAFLTAAITGRDLMPSGEEGNPRVGYCETPMWPDAEPSMREAFPQMRERLVHAGFTVTDMVLPEIFGKAHEIHRVINDREGYFSLSHERLYHADKLSSILIAALENGATYNAYQYDEARQTLKQARLALTKLWRDVDILIAPSVTGEAPKGIGFTGNSAFNRLWTAMGVPCVNLPCGHGPNGLPLGVQVIGPALGDKRTLAAAAALADAVAGK